MNKEQFINKIAETLDVKIDLAKRNELENIYNDLNNANSDIISGVISELEDIQDELEDDENSFVDVSSVISSLKSIN